MKNFEFKGWCKFPKHVRGKQRALGPQQRDHFSFPGNAPGMVGRLTELDSVQPLTSAT